ncbi:MAG: transferrin receptor-like dimerization domain-containing protein [Acidobacteriota bacterium]|jgi:N-acetylated-alpha-linked acidic dipeptidase
MIPTPTRPVAAPLVLLALLAASVLLAASTLLAAPAAAAASDGDAPLLGFTAEGSAAQRDLERRLDALVDKDNLRAWMERLAARPHHLGSPWDRENARFMAGLFDSWGYETEIEEFLVPFPVPTARTVEMLEPEPYTAAIDEPAIPEDSTSGQKDEQLPLYNAYSAAGDVTGELVYVNYGVPDDYEELARRGIDVAGKLVIARYGGSWRGIKPKVAAEHGAVGCILYSDPRDDGYFVGDAYPEGGYRNRHSGQRGSVMDMPRYAGDPTTPGRGSVAGVQRTPADPIENIEDAPTITEIPVLPIPWSDALPLLEALGGPVAPEAWRGALPLTYHLGPGPAKVRLALDFDWRMTTVYDVIARWPGAELPDEWVLRGNHHDAWVNGAADPVSGMVTVLEEARVVAELARAGHPPKRTLVYAGWGAEEEGLIGSTEWAETHADALREKAVAYINTDGYGRGFFGAGGSHSLERLVNQVAAEVPDPDTGATLAERHRAALRATGDEETRAELRERADLRIDALGSGSDYTPFLQHLGIASLNLGFGGHGDYGQYHSAYDSIDHYQRFMDPGYLYGAAMVSTAGRLTLRLANADLLPLRFGNAAETYAGYLDDLMTRTDAMRKETEAHNRRIDDGVWELFADPTETLLPPERKDPVPFLAFAPLQNAVARVSEAASRYDRAVEALAGREDPLPADTRNEVNRLLRGAERTLTRPEGLPDRPWYVHHVYAPGFYTGYGVKTLPTVREAIEQRRWDQVEEQIHRTADVLRAYAERIDAAAVLLER